jgi:hypothetical protein
MNRYAQIIGGAVVNVIESATPPGGNWVPCTTQGPGWMFDGQTWTPPTPASTVPQQVTRFQGLAALHLAGHLDEIEAYMAQPGTARITKLAWENALTFDRGSPTVASLAALLSLTPQEVDALFIAAKEIIA